MQFRLREGTGRQWFNPQRDMVYLWPRLLKRSLIAFDDFNGMPGCSQEQMCTLAQKLGKLVVRVLHEPVDHEMSAAELRELETECPVCFQELSRVAFHTLAGIYAVWVADAKPRKADDAEIPEYGLDEIAERLARNARGPSKPGV